MPEVISLFAGSQYSCMCKKCFPRSGRREPQQSQHGRLYRGNTGSQVERTTQSAVFGYLQEPKEKTLKNAILIQYKPGLTNSNVNELSEK